MTDEERIVALEARLAYAEARLAILEGSQSPLFGYQCGSCGAWVTHNTLHSCTSFRVPFP